jgi:protein-S-isoprenylcysteine O-methyltransferase Ste14
MTADSTERGARVRFPPPLVFVSGALIGIAVGRLAMPAPVPLGSLIRIAIGVAIVIGGLAPMIAARIDFVRTGQSVIPWTPTPELIIRGPYRFTRNPMYVGMMLVEIGVGVAVNNLWISLFALPALAVVHVIAVLPEEAYLSHKFGDGYRSYLRRVRRYF